MSKAVDAAARYCRVDPLFIECGERLFFDPAALFRGEVSLGPQPVLRAWAPGALQALEIDAFEAGLLAALPATAPGALPEHADPVALHRAVTRLLDLGLLRETAQPDRPLADWWSPAALYHFSSRWDGVLARDDVPDSAESAAQAFARSQRQLAEHAELKGPPPEHRVRHGNEAEAFDLPQADEAPLDALLRARETHRLYRTDRPLPLEQAASLLRRSFGVLGEAPVGGGLTAVRKSAPSGGGMHPVEAYLLAVDVQQLRPGWYHYRGDQHRLAPMRYLDTAEARERVAIYTAGQRYFASAPMIVALGLRFPRHHWKYPQHAKALRVMLLEAGHLGQTFYLSATEQGLGAFFTCAINEGDLDRDLGFDGLSQGCIALLGAGWPSDEGAALRLSNYQQAVPPR